MQWAWRISITRIKVLYEVEQYTYQRGGEDCVNIENNEFSTIRQLDEFDEKRMPR